MNLGKFLMETALEKTALSPETVLLAAQRASIRNSGIIERGIAELKTNGWMGHFPETIGQKLVKKPDIVNLNDVEQYHLNKLWGPQRIGKVVPSDPRMAANRHMMSKAHSFLARQAGDASAAWKEEVVRQLGDIA